MTFSETVTSEDIPSPDCDIAGERTHFLDLLYHADHYSKSDDNYSFQTTQYCSTGLRRKDWGFHRNAYFVVAKSAIRKT